MTRTYENEDGVLVVEAGPVLLESVSNTSEPPADAEPEEEDGHVVRPGAGE